MICVFEHHQAGCWRNVYSGANAVDEEEEGVEVLEAQRKPTHAHMCNARSGKIDLP